MTTTNEYYVRKLGEVDGPFTGEELYARVRQGQLGRFDELSTDGQSWERAEVFEEFFAVATPDIESRLRPPAPPARSTPYGRAPEHDSSYAIEPMEARLAEPEPVSAEPVAPAEPVTRAYDNVETATPTHNTTAPVANTGQPQQEWYYAKSDTQFGPVQQREIALLIAAGELTPYDHVWTEGLAEWTPISALPAVFPAELSGGASRSDEMQPSERRQRSRSRRTELENGSVSGMAIASLILSLVPLWGLNCPLAIVFGVVAIQQIMQSNGYIRGMSLAIAGIAIAAISLIAWVGYFFAVL